ncbi:hypothetical protein [Nocardioides stalactiti]|uniref:hypothetical protein n=1 Tax=Nocardioides stalactiti TaxID=2755356 RepID=UPI0015FF9CBB|nr:hypothetical protein [Nocardioides stalactiti]
MKTARPEWSVAPFRILRSSLGSHQRPIGPPASPENELAVEVTGARITDRERNLIYEATIERGPSGAYLTGLTILTTRKGQRIDQSMIRAVPVQRIAEAVGLHLIEQEKEGMAVFNSRTPMLPGERPSPQEIAALWRQGKRRKDLITHFSPVSPFTIDDWIRETRDLGLIPMATTGRKRQPPTKTRRAPKPATTEKENQE